jgi:hypothetical protein
LLALLGLLAGSPVPLHLSLASVACQADLVGCSQDVGEVGLARMFGCCLKLVKELGRPRILAGLEKFTGGAPTSLMVSRPSESWLSL